MKHILIIGATSAIVHATAIRFAETGAQLYLVARNEAKLRANADDLRVRGASRVEVDRLDVNELAAHGPLLERAWAALGEVDVVLVGHGTLPDQPRSEQDIDYALAEFQTNATSTIALLARLANRLEAQQFGTLAVISSVAGDRGRKSNYLYGAAKSAVTTYLAGLRGRLHRAGVRVITIKPGLIDSPMTAHLDKGPLFSSADKAGALCYDAILKGKETVYVPSYWRLIMTLIKLMPETIFKRLNLSA
ncbi:MAG: SDR family oxidoreductase [Anaerolineales bacterium]|nr:SDR family oxidoreductase [Anaerolineales bacterium]